MSFFAYLDPGSGSLIIQAIIGALAGVGFFFRDAIKGLFSKLRRLVSRKKPD